MAYLGDSMAICEECGQALAAGDEVCATCGAARVRPAVDVADDESARPRASTRRLSAAGVAFAVAGLLLFVYVVWNADVTKIYADLRRLGAGFLLILLLSGFRFAVRALAWTLCFEAPHRLRFRDAFRAYLTGDAVGNIVPLGIVVSEPAKAALVRDRVPLVAGLSAIAVENIFYSLSVALFVSSGAVALLWSFELSRVQRWLNISVLMGMTAVVLLGFAMVAMQWKVLSGALERLYARGVARRLLETGRVRVRSLEERVYGFYRNNQRRFLPILFLEACFHAAGVAEAYVTLYFVNGEPPSLLAAFVLESVNRVINVVFKFVPLRVGVDEAGTGKTTQLLQLGATVGVTLAIVRKARMLCWTGLGVALLVARGLSVRDVAEEAARAKRRDAKELGMVSDR